jgi:gliding motility-associated-like protein
VSTFSKQIEVPVLPLIADYDAEPVQACFPADITVTANRSTGSTHRWELFDSKGKRVFLSGELEPVFQLTNPGRYVLRYRVSQDNTSQPPVDAPPREFEIYGNPVASFDARPDVVFVPDTELITFNYSSSATEYEWDFGDNGKSTEEAPTYVYKIEGNYEITLIAKYDHGNGVVCSDTLKRQVTAKQGGVTKVPNAFTPSPNGPTGGQTGNGSFNDVFLPIVRGAEEFNMQIFDRWGNLIFESNSSTIGWDGYNSDGKLMPAGVYIYKLTLRLSDGQRSTQLGDITMIR